MFTRNRFVRFVSHITGNSVPRTAAQRRAIASRLVESLEARTLLSTSPSITTPNQDTLYAGVGGTYTVIATGSPTPSCGETGTLPSGVSFIDNGDGTATFTIAPTANSASPTVTITASNGVPSDATQSFTLHILQPNVLTVTNLDDSGPGSLRAAITSANQAGGVDLIEPSAGVTGKIALHSALPNLAANIIIMGKGLTISGAASTGPVLTVNAGFTCEFHNLTITGGRGVNGGGIDNEGTLAIYNSTITGNNASTSGGGIFNNTAAVLTLTDSTLSKNSALHGGGGIFNAGGIVTCIDSTLNNNSAGNNAIDGGGGGIDSESPSGNSGTLTVTNCTIAFNTGGFAGGIEDDGAVMTLTDSTIDQNKTISTGGGVGAFVSGGTVTINGTIIAKNTSPDLASASTTIVGSYDLIGDGSDAQVSDNLTCTLTNTLRGTETHPLDPKLSGLANNGGPTPTQAEMAGAPGIGMGSDFPVLDSTNFDITKTDQRHINRPRNGGIDIGAYQLPPTFAATKLIIQPIAKSITAGHTIASSATGSSFTVDLVNAKGQIDTTNNSSITIAIATGPQGSALNGTVTVQAVAGIATITGLSIDTAGNYTLQATDGGLAPGLSSKFTVTPDASSPQLVLVQHPASSVIGAPVTPAIVADIEDQFGNIITTDHSKVTLTLPSGPGTLSGTTTVNVTKGIATFSKALLSSIGSYTMILTDSAFNSPSPVGFALTVTKGVTVIAIPKVAASYKAGKAITLTSSLKSSAPTSIPFTGAVTIVDQDATNIATGTLSTNGALKFVINNLTAGTYTCTIDYAGDPNHTAIDSDTFTLHVV